MMEVFYKAVSLKRAHGSHTEGQFVAWLAARRTPTMIDGAGNLHYDLRVNCEKSLFVAHTDTVHRTGGSNAYKRDGSFIVADGDVLGADDAAGLQVLSHMMDNNVPGYYIFTRAEEKGGIGSSWLAKHMPDLLMQFDRAIAFDRKDVYSVITYQAGGRCCSDAFGEALAELLCDQGLLYSTDETGVYTDTAEFIDLIPECTNISAGYYAEHSSKESQDTVHLQALMTAAAAMRWEDLPTERSMTEDLTMPFQLEEALHAADNRKPKKLRDWLFKDHSVNLDMLENASMADFATEFYNALTWTDRWEDALEEVIFKLNRGRLARAKKKVVQ